MLIAAKRASHMEMRLAEESLVPLLRTLRDKHGTMEMEVVDHSLGLVATLSGAADHAAAAELRTYLAYLTALAPARVVVDLSAVSPVAPHVFDSLQAFCQDVEADGGEVQVVGLRRHRRRSTANDMSHSHLAQDHRPAPLHSGLDVVQALWS